MQGEDPTNPITPEGQRWEGKARGRGRTEGPQPSVEPGWPPGRGDTAVSREGRESSLHMAEGTPGGICAQHIGPVNI